MCLYISYISLWPASKIKRKRQDMNSLQTCNSVTFYFMKNSFSDVSRKWILQNMIGAVQIKIKSWCKEEVSVCIVTFALKVQSNHSDSVISNSFCSKRHKKVINKNQINEIVKEKKIILQGLWIFEVRLLYNISKTFVND